MMEGKIVTAKEWDSIHADIMEGQNIPRTEKNGYVITSYLPDKSEYKHPKKELFFIPKDSITVKYCEGFEVLSSDWIDSE